MHACLNVDEIIRLIVHQLVRSRAKATAIALACCCKNFEDPVLDVLWETQDGLLPLLKSLPTDVWNEGGYTVSAPIAHISYSLNSFIRKSFKRPPTTLEWARFRMCAQKIRELRDYGYQSHPSSEVLSVLEHCVVDEPLFPHLKTLELWFVTGKTIPFIPLFLSPRNTIVKIGFIPSDSPTEMIAQMITAFPTLCPNLQGITFNSIPRDPIITAAVSGMLIANNPNTLRSVYVESPLTEEALKVIFKLPNLRELLVIIERDTSLPSMVLPNLTTLVIVYDGDGDWLPMFHEATFEKLEAVTFNRRSEQIGDFLETFERVALDASVQNTLTQFSLYTSRSWNPNYSSLLRFTQLTEIIIEFSCNDSCSSRLDDDIITKMARAMPKLEFLVLGDSPCREIPIGVTVKGLVALADHCTGLSDLCIHLEADSLREPPAIIWTPPNVGPTALRRDCALKTLVVGEMPMPEGSVPMVALTIARIFPHLEYIDCVDENWKRVVDAVRLQKIVDFSSEHPSLHLEATLMTFP